MAACPCCGDETLSDQQIRRHLLIRQRELATALDAMDQVEAGPAPHDDGLALLDIGLAPDDAMAPFDNVPAPLDNALALFDNVPAPLDHGPALDNLEPLPAQVRWRGIDLAALIAREDEPVDIPADLDADLNDENMMDLDDGDELFAPLPDALPRLGMRRNPPVEINDWASEDELEDITPPASDVDEASIGSNERDPEFDEYDWMRGFDPDAEIDMDEEELRNFL
ncbi:hypothetical protein FS749_008178 [Ceratobasidium sp. UAMH 11750]|nr:hypothetical protein FS749_008178 [Ceratobasidium sp. UAMH 11750]